MYRITFWSIFLLWLITALHCKKYLVEVADGQGAVTQTSTEAPVDDAINEFESKYNQ